MKENDDSLLTLAMDVIGGKWKSLLIYHLQSGALRTGELRRRLPGITQKMLTQQLRELERDGLIVRKVFDTVPPKVEYSLTPLGESALPVLGSICAWGRVYAEQLPPERQKTFKSA